MIKHAKGHYAHTAVRYNICNWRNCLEMFMAQNHEDMKKKEL